MWMNTVWKQDLIRLKVLCYNVLFDLYEDEGKTKELKRSSLRHTYQIKVLLPQSNADIIVLTEVTKSYIDKLMKEEWTKKYQILGVDAVLKNTHGCLMLSKLSSVKFTSVEQFYCTFFSLRSILIVQNDYYCFVVCHLKADDSGGNRRNIRKHQIEEVMSYLSQKDKNLSRKTYVVLGDMNLNEDENLSMYMVLEGPYAFSDAWTTIHDVKNRPGYTYDPSKNALLRKIWKNYGKPQRLDRIYVKSDYFEAKSIKLFGVQPVEKFYPNLKKIPSYLYASDHFGLVTILNKKKKK